MVLARCCPRWAAAVVAGPQPALVTARPAGVATLLRYSLVWQAALVDLFGADHPGRSPRAEVNWVYWSYRLGLRLQIKAQAHTVESCSDLWPAALWLERELWEMVGVGVRGHPDLRRLVTDYGFVGHPLRKDFPVVGYLEVRYSEVARRVVSRPVALTQEFRHFDFTSPWLT